MRFLSGFLKIANFSQLGTWEDKGFCFHSSALHQDSDVAKRHPSAIDPPTVVRQSSTFLTNIFVTFARHGDSERYYMEPTTCRTSLRECMSHVGTLLEYLLTSRGRRKSTCAVEMLRMRVAGDSCCGIEPR